MPDRARQPAGTPAGGQFATTDRPEAGLGLAPGVGRKPGPRLGQSAPDPRATAAGAARTEAARGAGSRADIGALAPIGRAEPASGEPWHWDVSGAPARTSDERYAAAAERARSAEDTAWARGMAELADLVRADHARKTRRRWWQFRR